MVDHYSDYIELDSLSGNISANSVIRAMKRQFARHGIPDKLITDNGPQFESHECSRFAREYGFTLVKSSPYYSRGNGKADSAVKISKNILKKSRKEGPYLSLLAYRNTPQQGYNYSPAKRLMSRRLKDIIPTAQHQLTLQTASPCLVHDDIAERRRRSMVQYNKRVSQPLREFSKGETGFVKPRPENKHQPWICGEVIGRTGPRFCSVNTSRDQFEGITHGLDRQRLNQTKNSREEMSAWKLYPCLKVSLQKRINQWSRNLHPKVIKSLFLRYAVQ
ncbi:uncharacterized protein [Montipora foliosa]|uniref:uncharacterized protein n=1 Tax=Montipora foliosa TaxID=591990 RepID=UPI0035F1B930